MSWVSHEKAEGGGGFFYQPNPKLLKLSEMDRSSLKKIPVGGELFCQWTADEMFNDAWKYGSVKYITSRDTS